MVLAGIDIGGTKVTVCLGDKSGKVLTSKRIATKNLTEASPALREIEMVLKELLKGEKLEAIGISAPGPICLKEGKMLTPPNLPGWHNTPLVSFFEKAFHVPVSMNHDAKAAVLAEYRFGGAKGCQNLVYLTCSTGMGGGAIAGGKLIQGASDTAAEVGHFILDLNGPLCACGQKGCFESFCGGAMIAEKIRREIGQGKTSKMVEMVKGDISHIDASTLVEAVRVKDPYALTVWEEFTTRMAQGIGTVLMCFNPEKVVLGTIAIHSGDLLLHPVRKKLHQFAWKENVAACTIEASHLGDQISELSGLALAVEKLQSR